MPVRRLSLLYETLPCGQTELRPHRPDDDPRGVRCTRGWVVVVSVASALVAVSPFASDIMSLTSLSGALYGACFLPALVVGMFLQRARAGAVLASSVCGLLAVVGWYTARMLGLVSLHEVYNDLLVGIGVYLLIALTGPKENQVPS